MSQPLEQSLESGDLDVEHIEEDLGIFEVRLEEKLKELTRNFETQGYTLDVNKAYYDHFSSSDAKFKDIMNDLTDFLIKDELASTPTLRSTFYKVLDNPLFCLFKSSKFELFELCLNGFDIEYEADEAIKEVHKGLLRKTEELKQLVAKGFQPNKTEMEHKVFSSIDSLLFYSSLKSIQLKLFTLYSYVRKGASFLKKEYKHRLFVAELFASLEKELIPTLVQLELVEPLKELATLNFEIFNVEPTYDYFFFFFSIPPKKGFLEVYSSIKLISEKCEKNNNYNPFVVFVLKHHKQLNSFIHKTQVDQEYVPLIQSLLEGGLRLLRAEVGLYEEFVSVLQSLLHLSRTHYSILESFLTYKPGNQKDQLIAIRDNFREEILSKNPAFLFTLRPLTFEQVRVRLQKAQDKYLFSLNFADVEKTKLKHMLELTGGIPQRFFDYIEGDLKAWNPTVSITGRHKYIKSQFQKLEEIDTPVLGHLQMLNNFLYLSETYPKEYEALFETKLNSLYFLDLLEYLVNNPQSHKALDIELEFYILNVLALYVLVNNQKQLLKVEDKASYLGVFSKASSLVHTPNNQLRYITDLIKQIESLKYQLTTKEYIDLLTTLAVAVPNSSEQCFRTLLSSFSELDSYNARIKANRFHGQSLSDVLDTHISKEEAKLLKEKYHIVDHKLVSTDSSLFKFTSQDVSTNPLNFDSRIDDVFISLATNPKKVIQIVVLELVAEIREIALAVGSSAGNAGRTSEKLRFLLGIITYLCREYPIVVPYLVSLKVSTSAIKEAIPNAELKQVVTDNITLGEFLCQAELICNTNKAIPKFITCLLKERGIRYLNGKDYIKQEVAPTISETLVKMINSQRTSQTLKQDLPRVLSLLVLSLEIQGKLSREQTETVRGALIVLRKEISSCESADRLFELSAVYRNCIRLFYRFKGYELNKPLLESTYPKYSHLQIHNYDTKEKVKPQPETLEKLKNQVLLNFTINFDFDIANTKLAPTDTQPTPQVVYDVPARDILNEVKVASNKHEESSIQHQELKQVTVDLHQCKYNLLYHLGVDKLKTICSRTETRLRLPGDRLYPERELTNEQEELKNIIAFYSKEVYVPDVQDKVLEGAVVRLLQGEKETEFFRNSNNFEKVCGLLTILLVRDVSTLATWPDNEITRYLKEAKIDSDAAKHEEMVNHILDIFSEIGYSNFWVYSFQELQPKQLKVTTSLLQNSQIPKDESLLSLVLKFTLESYVNHKFSSFSHFSRFIRCFFENRPHENQILTYKVTVNKTLLNLLLKCIDFEHLSYVSILFYSNFENLRLYTDDLQEGFKALNLASKTRAYNEFLKLSNEYNDTEYLNPLKIFKQNLKFFVKIEKEGYLFKVEQEASITVERIINQLKAGETTHSQIDSIMDQYFFEVDKLKANTINRIKSIYLTAKLRDLSLQNGTTISLLHDVLEKVGATKAQILEEINKVEIFSIISNILYDLLSFEDSYCNLNKYANYNNVDSKTLKDDIVFSTTRRFGFNMNKHLNQLEFEFDEVVQSALINAKPFLISEVGTEWVQGLTLNPALTTYNRVRVEGTRTSLLKNIEQLLTTNNEKPALILLRENFVCEDLVKQQHKITSENFLKKDGLVIEVADSKQSLDNLASKVIAEALSKQILLKQDDTYILNKNKFSEDSLDVLEALGMIVSYCIFWKIKIDLPLHHSIICQLCSTIVDLDDLLTVDFKTWEYLRMVLSEADSKTLNLNFTYEFDALNDPTKKEKTELVEKGVQKKVNNLNREEYCDFICCKILFGNVRVQLERFLTGAFKVLPKQYIANLKFGDVFETFYKTPNKLLNNKLSFQSLKKFGIILPETYSSKAETFQNLKDFVNINWLVDSLKELTPEKFSKFCQSVGCKESQFLNLRIYTKTGLTESLELLTNQSVVINHFKTKEGMKGALNAKL